MRDIKTLDLNLLKALDALLVERNVTRAATRLNITQPAMSAVLAKLRESFDDPLFIRTQRGIIPTQRALHLATPVQHLLREIEALLQPPCFEPSQAELRLSIASTDYALRTIIVPFIKVLNLRAPHISIATLPLKDELVPLQMERGEVDLCLTTPERTPPDLHTQTIWQESYVCVLRHDHPALNHTERLSLEQFCALDHVLVSYSGGNFSGVTDAALARLGLQRRVKVSVNSFLVLPEILGSSDLIAVVPQRLVKHLPDLKILVPPLEIPGFTKVAAWHERTQRDPAHRWLRELLFEVCKTTEECYSAYEARRRLEALSVTTQAQSSFSTATPNT